MHAVDVNGHLLELTDEAIIYDGHAPMKFDDVEGINVIVSDSYINGAWVNGTRFIGIRGDNRTLRIDCSRLFPNRAKLDETFFTKIYGPIRNTLGFRLVQKVIARLEKDKVVEIGGSSISCKGVWVDGSWRLLWLKAKQKLVPWTDLKIFSNEGILFLQSKSKPQFRSEIKINNNENAMVLDDVVRSLLHDNNWKRLDAEN